MFVVSLETGGGNSVRLESGPEIKASALLGREIAAQPVGLAANLVEVAQHLGDPNTLT
jgi:hypothetical protein